MSHVRYLCLFAHSGVQRILCCVFVLFVFVLCTLCRQFLGIVYFWLPLRYSLTFVCLCLVYPMSPVSLDCLFSIAPSVFSNVYLSCVPYVTSFFGLSIFDCPFGILYRLFILCTLCYQFLWIVLFDCPFGILYRLFILCTLCYQFLWIVYFRLPLRYSLTFIYLVYPMLPVSLDCPFWLPLRYSLSFIYLVYPMLPVSLDCLFSIAPSVFSNVIYLVYPMLPVSLDCPFWLPLRYSLTFIYLVYPMSPVSLNCLFLIAPSVFSNVYLYTIVKLIKSNTVTKAVKSLAGVMG
jgi:hypothetical protein